MESKTPLSCCILLTPSESISSLNRPHASVEIKNESEKEIVIEWVGHPFIHLNLLVTDPGGRLLNRSFYGSAYFGQGGPAIHTLRLKPGEFFSAPISPFATVKLHDVAEGIYKIQAIYQFGDLDIFSEPVELQVRSNIPTPPPQIRGDKRG